MRVFKNWDARFLATLALGIIATEGGHVGNLGLLALLLAAALIVQEKVIGKKPLALDSVIRKKNEFNDKIYYRGSLLDPDTKSMREKLYLSLTCGGEKQMELRGVFLAFAFVYGFVAIKMPWASLTLTSFMHFVAILTLISRASRSHSLVSLGLNAVAVSFGLYKTDGHITLPYVLYVVCFFFTFFTFHIDRKAHLSQDLKPSLFASAAFLFIYFLFSTIFPEHPSHPLSSTSLAQNNSGWGRTGNGSGFGSSNGGGSGSGQGQGRGSGMGTSSGSGGGSGSVSGQEQTQGQSGQSSNQAPSGNARQSSGDQRVPSGGQPQHAQPQNGAAPSASEEGGGVGGGVEGSASSETGDRPQHKIPEFKLPEDLLKKFLWLLGGALAAYILYRFLTSKKKKSPLSKRQPLPLEVRNELVTAIKAVNAAKLSPRDRIIKQYLLFLKIMEAAEHPRESSLPPRDYITTLGSVFPQQSASFTKLTDVYSDTFYGNHMVKEEDLRHYDDAFKSVAKHFLKSA